MFDSKIPEKEEAPKKEDCAKLKEDDLLKQDENPTKLLALARCDCLMIRYLRWKKRNHDLSDTAQIVALVFTAITPVLVLVPWNSFWGLLPVNFGNIVGAATAALAAIATGLLAITGWRDNYIRYGYIWHALQTEKYHYLTRATKEYLTKDEEKAARNFAARIEQLIMADVTDWRNEMQRAQQPNGRG